MGITNAHPSLNPTSLNLRTLTSKQGMGTSLDRSCTPLPRQLDRKRHTRNTAQVTQGVNSSIKSPLKPMRELSIGFVSHRLNPTSNLWSSTNNCKPGKFSNPQHITGCSRSRALDFAPPQPSNLYCKIPTFPSTSKN